MPRRTPRWTIYPKWQFVLESDKKVSKINYLNMDESAAFVNLAWLDMIDPTEFGPSARVVHAGAEPDRRGGEGDQARRRRHLGDACASETKHRRLTWSRSSPSERKRGAAVK